jgi:hypothetical protein
MARLPAPVLLAICAACTAAGDRPPAPPRAAEEGAARALGEGRTEEARARFLAAASEGGSSFWSAIGLARVAIALGESRDFDLHIQDAMRLAGRDAQSYDLLGRTLLEAAQREPVPRRIQHARLALAFFAQARAKDSSRPRLAYHAGLAQHLSGRPGESLAFLEAARVEEGPEPHVVAALVAVHQELGRPDRIVELLEGLQREGALRPEFAPDLERAREAARARPPG